MKTLLLSFLLLAANLVQAQCTKNYFVLSPTVGKTPGASLSVNIEAGLVPYLSKSYVSVKSSLWTQPSTIQYTNSKGEAVSVHNDKAAAFIGLNYGYVPLAFEEVARKWVFGAAAGTLLQEGQQSRPAALLSAAYTIRMTAGNYADGLGCLKIEGTCLASALSVKPGISAGVFLLL